MRLRRTTVDDPAVAHICREGYEHPEPFDAASTEWVWMAETDAGAPLGFVSGYTRGHLGVLEHLVVRRRVRSFPLARVLWRAGLGELGGRGHAYALTAVPTGSPWSRLLAYVGARLFWTEVAPAGPDREVWVTPIPQAVAA